MQSAKVVTSMLLMLTLAPIAAHVLIPARSARSKVDVSVKKGGHYGRPF
jgi:hypothetical protein